MSVLRWIAWSALGMAGAAATPQDAPPNGKDGKESKPALERSGTFVPAAASEVTLGLESFAGELKLVEVAPHGAVVREGAVLARFDTKAIDEAIESAQREAQSVDVRRQNALEQARLDEESAEQRIERARKSQMQAQRGLEAFEKNELVLKHRQGDMSEQFGRDGIEDQQDELHQLEKMYTADELVDATEEVVLKRSRRQIARSQASLQLSMDRRRFDTEYSESEQLDQKRDAARDAQRELDRLTRQIEIERRSRTDSLARLDPDLQTAREKLEKLRRDRERLTVKAPRAGYLLHGGIDDYKPGHAAPRHEKDGTVAPKAKLFTVADAGRFSVALDLPESQINALTNGMAVKVTPVAEPGASLEGRLRFERFPDPKSAGAPENTYAATIEFDAAPPPSIVAGMRAKVAIETKKGGT